MKHMSTACDDITARLHTDAASAFSALNLNTRLVARMGICRGRRKAASEIGSMSSRHQARKDFG